MISIESLRALLMAFAAGACTVPGALIIARGKRASNRFLGGALGFAAGVMLGVSFAHMLPHAQESLAPVLGTSWSAVLSVGLLALGALLTLALDHLVPHDHMHCPAGQDCELYRVGIVSACAIALHNLPEGVAIYVAGYQNTALGISLAVAIALHNIPLGISIATPIYAATGSRIKSILLPLACGLAEPLGALIACLFLQSVLSPLLLGCLLPLVAGILLCLALHELLPAARTHGHAKFSLVCALIGACLIVLSHFLE